MATRRSGSSRQPAKGKRGTIGTAAEASLTARPARNRPQAPARPAPATLQVQVVHGNLAYIGEPLFIGHYSALALSGAERVVNRHIGGTLAQALALQSGHYPDEPGTHQAFINTRRDPERPHDMPRPQAVVVVGLGAEGTLTETVLTVSVRQAVIDWLQRQHESAPEVGPPPEGVPIAATLIGSGGFGISPGASARAIVRAVMDANRRVAEVGWDPVTRLNLIELYLDRAADAWRELTLLSDGGGRAPAGFALDPLIGAGSGGKRRPLETSYRGADYDFVRITGRDNGTIEFALDSRSARSEVRSHCTQSSLVQAMAQQAAQHTMADPRLGRTLFHLLVPPAIEPYVSGKTRLMLDLSDSVAALPWELLDTGEASDEPWALRVGLLRKLQSSSERDGGRRDSVPVDQFLVIGDPQLPPGSAWQPLPGARAEAVEVAKRLRAHTRRAAGQVIHLDRVGAQEILNTLYQKPWRVLHVAGHGAWTAGRGGVVLSTPGAFLGPDEMRAMRSVPELVFMNCCHLGRNDTGDRRTDQALQRFAPGDLAAGVATALIRMGVRCVVAAGWAVDDAAALAFARGFYSQLLAGQPFGEAVAAARRAAWQQERGEAGLSGGGNTWAAFQCYGDPDWRLLPGSALPPSDGARPSPAARYAHVADASALMLALESLAIDVRWGGQAPDAVVADLDHLARHFGHNLAHQGEVAEALGMAYAEADALDQAIRWLAEAVGAEDASASFKALESLGNLLSRAAYESARDIGLARRPAALGKALAQVDQALALLQPHAEARNTDRAHALVGSAHKRRVMVLQAMGRPREEIDAALASMGRAYSRSLERARLPDGQPTYPLQNLAALALRQALAADDPASPGVRAPLDHRLAQWEQAFDEALQRQPGDEWLHLGPIDLALYRALIEAAGGVAQDLEPMLARLDDLHARIPGSKFWRSVWDQWDFVLGQSPKARQLAGVRSLLERLARYGEGAPPTPHPPGAA